MNTAHKQLSRQKNIVIAYQYFSFKGGIEDVITHQAAQLQKRNYKVSILCSRYANNEPNQTADGIEIIRTDSINWTYALFGIPFAVPILTLPNIYKIYNTIKHCDVLNVHGHPYLSSFIYVWIAKHLKKRIILTQHNTEIQSKSKLVDFIYKLADKTIGAYVLHMSDEIVAVSKATADYIRTLTSNPHIHVIYNGVDYEKFHVKQPKANLRKDLGLPVNKFICFTVRRITFKNGIDNLLSCAELLKNKEILFVIGGTGPDLAKAKAYIKDKKLSNIRFVGFISDEALPKFYASANAFVLPSRKGEGFPIAILEAMSSGLPIIATRSGGHTEVIKNYTTGLLVDAQRPEQMLTRIHELYENTALCKTLGQNSRTLIVKRFSWEKNINTFTQLIERGSYGFTK